MIGVNSPIESHWGGQSTQALWPSNVAVVDGRFLKNDEACFSCNKSTLGNE